jgi:hypothetical protein
MEQLCRVSELEDEFESLSGAAGASHNAPEVSQEARDAAKQLSRVQWRKAPVVQTTDQATAALAKIRWRTAVSDVTTGRGNVTTGRENSTWVTAAEAAVKMKAMTLGVSMPSSQTARPMKWVSKRLDDTDQGEAGAAAGASARRGNPEAPAALHNKTTRHMSEYTGSRDDMSQEVVDDVENLLKLEESAKQQAKGGGQEEEEDVLNRSYTHTHSHRHTHTQDASGR